MEEGNSQNLEMEEEIKIIGICGGTCCGKSTVCAHLCKSIDVKKKGAVIVIPQDCYYKGGDEKTNYDEPSSIEFPLLIDHIKRLKKGEAVDIPIYDFKTHSRLKETRKVEPTDIIIVEGILIFNVDELRELFDLKVFIDALPELRVLRRMKRDCSERGRTEDQVKKQYERDVIKSTRCYVTPHQDDADLILKNNKDGVFIGLKVLECYIKSHIKN